jgi:release factor glutamine methyltransferase
MSETDDETRRTQIAGALAGATRMLCDNGIDQPRRDAQTLLGFVLERSRTYLVVHSDKRLSTTESERFRRCIQRRAAGEPVQHITGQQEFYGLEFEVTPDVLIPRPETEMLVEAGLELLAQSETTHAPGETSHAPGFCDVGTGSGCITISILHNHPQARAFALDISTAALAVARRNATRHDVAERVKFIESNLFANLESDARFDFIVSNPPYIAADELPTLAREVRDFEPRVALSPGADGLAVVRRLLDESPARLRPGGV